MDQNVALGGTAIFTVTTTSGTALSYQWYKDGLLDLDTALAGQTSSTLTISNVGLLDPGTFYVVVKNAGGSVSSRHANLNLVLLNNPPVAVPDDVSVPEDSSVNVRVLDNDSDPEGSTLTIASATTTNGTVVINNSGSDGRIRFTPPHNFFGTVVFSYTISDGTLSATGNVTVTVTPVNDAPVANNDSYSSSEDRTLVVGVLSEGALTAGVLANDVDVEGDPLTALLVSTVSHGTLVFNSNGSFSYTPNPDYNGTDSFTYRASDGSLTGNVATVTIQVAPVSDPLRFASMQMTATGFELQIAGDAAPYVISASGDLQNWTPIFTNAEPSGTLIYTDTAALNYPSRFYRVDTR